VIQRVFRPAKSPDQAALHDLNQLRSELLNYAILITFGLAMAGLVLFVASAIWNAAIGAANGRQSDPADLLPVYVLVALCVAAYLVRSSGVRLTALILLIGHIATMCIGIGLRGDGNLGYFAVPVVVLAGVLLDTLPLLLVAALASAGLTGAFQLGWYTSGSAAILLVPLACIWLTALVTWISSANMRAALVSAWADTTWASQKLDEVQAQRAETQRLVKSLDEALLRIEQQNRALEVARLEAERARRAKAEFAANVSHELLTPINLIVGFSEMICLSPENYGNAVLPSAYRGDCWSIYRSAKHLKSLINDVLELSALDTGRMVMVKELTDLNELVQEVASFAHDLVRSKGLELRVDMQAGAPATLCAVDRTRIRQVWLNLIRNAVRFTDSGSITLRLEVAEGEVVCSVADTGVGIRDQDIPQLFQEFHQLDNSLRREHDGTGLGLALSKRFVEQHGGRIWVDSTPGHGSTFHFALPNTPTLALAN
jgi:signal transduction histidine kinase